MENNFEQLIAALQICSSYSDSLCEIRHVLEKQNSELLSSFISQFYQSILILEHWAWELFSKTSHQWMEEPKYLELLHTLALFNKNLIFNYDDIDANTKGSLLIPETVDCINVIFERFEKTTDENDPFISIVSLWFDNLSYFLHDNNEFAMSSILIYITHYIVRKYVMTDQYKFYLNQLHQSPLSPSIFTAKHLFYIKTCSLFLSSYLFAKAQDFIYTSQELLHHFGSDYVQILLLHTCTIESWSAQLLTCIVQLANLFGSCCWWGGEKGPQTKIVFPTDLSTCEYIDALIRIIDYKPFSQSITRQGSNDQAILLDTTLFSILNIAQDEYCIWIIRSKTSLPDTLLSIAKISPSDKICSCIYAILGEIICDERLKELKISRTQIANTNKVSLLIEICDQYPIVYDILWALSFNNDIQEQLRSNTSFITKLAYLPKESDHQIRKIAYGILWNLEINHEDRTKLAISNERSFEIMISYSHKDKMFCKQLYDQLIKLGYRVWIDFDQMHGNVMDAMAQAIEQSNTILICMSEQYQRSNYCRAEANYAFQRRIRIVPILLQQHYKPDGWLLFLVGQLLYVDFTKYEFSQAMEMLIKELKAPVICEICSANVYSEEEVNATIPTKQMSSEPSLALILPENILDWNQTNVYDWLTGHGLLQMSRLFANFNGRSLMYMNELIENVELQQVVSLLQDDSLRRTSQNLSVVELSHFRSVFNKQKQSLTSTIVTESPKVKIDELERKSFFYCQII
ncbi:unnamed protein product [Rotaria sp. Silwood2]|nr:unnamed protein product [Rotaria sp. Silwood2]